MARGKTIPPLIRLMIIDLYKDKMPMAEIGRQLGYNRQTIHRVIDRYTEAQDVHDDG